MHAGQGQINVRQSWRTWEVLEPLYACRAGADQGEAELEDLGSVGATLCMQGSGRSR